MCEQYVAVAAKPFRIADLWPFTERLEQFGIASLGWGATWLAPDGSFRSHRDIGTFHADPARHEVGTAETHALLVHLRRPSKLSTIGLPDTQPFDDPAGRFSFSHNGDLKQYKRYRPRYREAGRILGKADTEVAARWLEDEWQDDASAADVLTRLHDTFGGNANFAVLTRDGVGTHYAGNDWNPVFTFDIGPIRIASTGIHSLDRSMFKYVVPEATNRAFVPLGTTATVSPAT